MPTYEVAAPDGTKYHATVPAGTSAAQVMAYVQSQHNPASPAAPAQSPGDAAFAAGQETGKNESGLSAGLDQAARQYLPLGLGTDVGAAARYVGQRVVGVKNPDSFATDLAYSGGQSQGETEGSPVASTVGGLTGGVGQAVALTPLLRAAQPFKASLALKTAAQGGTKLGNATKLLAQGATAGAELGAAQGGVQGGINGGNGLSLPGAAVGAATGGAEGAAVGGAGGLLASGALTAGKGIKALFSPAGDKSIAILAQKFGVSPTDLRSVYGRFKLDTGGTIDPTTGVVTGGRDPAMGELTDLYNRGEVHAMVGKNPLLGAAVANAADTSATTLGSRLTTQMAKTIGPGEDPAELVQARGANMTAAMDPLRDQKIPLAPSDIEFLRSEVLPNSGLTQLGRRGIHADLDTGELSIGSADTLRKSLNLRAQANPGEGFDQLASGIRDIATDASPGYKQALEDYGADSRYINGHAHGLTGKTIGQTSDPSLISDLSTPEGEMGYKSGIATRLNNAAAKNASSAASTAADLAQPTSTGANVSKTFSPIDAGALRSAAAAEGKGLESLQAIAPSMPKGAEGPNMGQAALSAVSHTWPMRVFHLIQAHLGAGMSDDVARVTARYLTDPSMAKQGIALMARHGITPAQTQQLLQRAAAGGAVVGNSAANQGQ